MRTILNNKVNKFFAGMAGFLIAVPLLIAGGVYAATVYPAGSLLQPNDVTSSHIRQNTILNEDVSTTAAIGIEKTKIGTNDGTVPFSGLGKTATSTDFTFSTSTRALTTGDLVVSQGTTTIRSVAYKWPSADGSANQALTTNGGGTLAWQTPTATQTTYSSYAGEALTAADAVVTGKTINIATTGTNAKNFGNASLYKWAQSYTETLSTNEIQLWLKKVGSPTDTVKVSIQADSAGAPSGTPLVYGDIAASTLTTSYAQYIIDLNTAQYSAGSGYWIVVERTGAQDAGNYYSLYGDGANTYAGGTIAYWDNATWTAQAEDMRANFISSWMYKTDADFTGLSNNFIGFAQSTASRGQAVTITTNGIATGFSGLTTGTQYYLSNTAGAISSSAGTNTRKVGIATATTTVSITNIW